MEATTNWQLEEQDDLDLGTALMPRRNRNDDAEMDITPMIDITFLLLIYFLVASTPDKNTAVDLPRALHGDAVSQLDAVVFTIGEGGLDVAPMFGGENKSPEYALSNDLEERATQIRDTCEKGFRENKTNVVIKADKGVLHREVSRVIKTVSKVEGMQIYLAVMETDSRG